MNRLLTFFLPSLAFLSSLDFLSSLAPLDASLPASFLSLLADESPPVDESAGGFYLTTSPPPSPPSGDSGSSVFLFSGAVVLAVSLLASAVLASPVILASFPELEALSVAFLSFLVSVAVLSVFLDPSDGPP